VAPAALPHEPPAGLLRDLIELGGAGAMVCEVGSKAPPTGAGAVRIGVCRRGAPPPSGLETFDILLCAEPAPPEPWVGIPEGLDDALEALCGAIARQPVAAAVAAQTLRATLKLSFDEALAAESIAYSMLLGSAGFRDWRAAHPARERPDDGAPRVRVDVADAEIAIRLTRSAARNAFDARMRDELAEALAFALDHPDALRVALSGEGPAFSAGGDLDEFGRAPDPGEAHLIRTLRSPARLAHALGDRLAVVVHGACVGAGIEVPAAAARLVARPDAYFRLPEVGMGLVPGAGGTASIPRRIGSHRAAWMAISGVDIDAPCALAWGLIDAVEPA
jgi:enoyl-CoA hydratase/carnithine racemase